MNWFPVLDVIALRVWKAMELEKLYHQWYWNRGCKFSHQLSFVTSWFPLCEYLMIVYRRKLLFVEQSFGLIDKIKFRRYAIESHVAWLRLLHRPKTWIVGGRGTCYSFEFSFIGAVIPINLIYKKLSDLTVLLVYLSAGYSSGGKPIEMIFNILIIGLTIF